MSFLKIKDLKVIREAAKSGDERAKAILEKLSKGEKQDVIDRLVSQYYTPEAKAEQAQANLPKADSAKKAANPEVPSASSAPVNKVDPNTPVVEASPDISSLLDKELDGCIDEDDIPDTSFGDFLKKKHTDMNRSKKGPEYFKAFDPQGRLDYIAKKTDGYNHKFDIKRKDIGRSFRDMDGAIGGYIQSVTDLQDDPNELDMGKASEVYDGLTGDDDFMHGFGRGWDSEDSEAVRNKLMELVKQYGKKTVLAALNTLRDDNKSFSDFRNGQIDQETKRYGKSLEDLLK